MSAITTSTDRLQISAGPQPRTSVSFAADVRDGLTAREKRLPSKYLYDELGSALFDAITVVPEYYLTRAETEILREWGWEIVRAIGNPVDFVELGSGSAVKTRILIEEALRVQRTLRYCPIDISAEALRASAQSLAATYQGLQIEAIAGDYFAVLGAGTIKRRERMLAMFMGSNIGNYEPERALELLGALAAGLKRGDALLLGVDLKKDPRVLEAAYDDAAGVTAAFNKNLLARINRELGADFDLRAFRHIATYDAQRGAVFSYLESLRDQDVRIDAADLDVHFSAGEHIHTESSYKYSPEDIAALAGSAGLGVQHSWTDKAQRFCVALLAPL